MLKNISHTMKYMLLTCMMMSYSCFRLLAQGDLPCAAVTLTVNCSKTNTAGTTAGAAYQNNAINAGTPSCGATGTPDVWYKFVATQTRMYFEACNTTDFIGLRMQIYSAPACTGPFTSVNCYQQDDCIFATFTTLTIGTTYYVRIWFINEIAGSKTFVIAVWDNPIRIYNGADPCNDFSFTCSGLFCWEKLYSISCVGGEHEVTMRIGASIDDLLSVTLIGADGTQLDFRSTWAINTTYYFGPVADNSACVGDASIEVRYDGPVCSVFTVFRWEYNECTCNIPAGNLWTWTGCLDTDWHNGGNWDKTTVPVSTSDVLIDEAPANQPIISTADADCFTIELETNSSLEIQGNWQLNVTGP